MNFVEAHHTVSKVAFAAPNLWCVVKVLYGAAQNGVILKVQTSIYAIWK